MIGCVEVRAGGKHDPVVSLPRGNCIRCRAIERDEVGPCRARERVAIDHPRNAHQPARGEIETRARKPRGRDARQAHRLAAGVDRRVGAIVAEAEIGSDDAGRKSDLVAAGETDRLADDLVEPIGCHLKSPRKRGGGPAPRMVLTATESEPRWRAPWPEKASPSPTNARINHRRQVTCPAQFLPPPPDYDWLQGAPTSRNGGSLAPGGRSAAAFTSFLRRRSRGRVRGSPAAVLPTEGRCAAGRPPGRSGPRPSASG